MHFKNPSRFKIAQIGVFIFCLAIVLPDQAKARRVKKTPDSGYSDQHVRAHGKDAEKFLVSKLSDPKEQNHYEGIIRQLTRIMSVERDDANVTQGLIQFVDKQVGREEIPPSVLYAVEGAIQIIGVRGGKNGIDYLGKWLDGGRAVSAHLPTADSALTAHRIKRAAIRALGLNAQEDGTDRLRKFKATSLKDPALSDSERAIFSRDLNEAAKDHEEVKKKGMAKTLKDRGVR